MDYQRAKEIAERKAELIRSGCARLEIVGSVKRGDKAEVHDIEFLCIADTRTPRPQLGQNPKALPKTMLEKVLFELCERGVLKFLQGGDKLKRYAIPEVVTPNILEPFKLELYIVREETWGIQNVIRTGPKLFSHRYVTNKSAYCVDKETWKRWPGLLPDDFKYIAGETKIMHGMNVLSLPEEQDALALLGMGWIPPKDRARVANMRR